MKKYFPTFLSLSKFITPTTVSFAARTLLYAVLMLSIVRLSRANEVLEYKVLVVNQKVNMYTEELRTQRRAFTEIIGIIEDLDARQRGKK